MRRKIRESGMKRAILALLVACWLTLLPFQVAIAGESSVGAEVTVLSVVSMSVPLQTTQAVSNEAQATGSQGAIIPISGDTLTWQVSEWKANISLPIALGAGQPLVSFTDPASGVDISGGRFTIPIRNANGDVVMSVVGEVEQVQGEGNSAKVIGKNVVLMSGSFSMDLSTADARVGQVSAAFQVSLRNLSQDQNASMKITINKDPDTGSQAAFERAAEDNHLIMGDIAYVLSVEKTNLENGINLGEAIITMKVGQAWVDRYGVGNIKVLCVTEAGEGQILRTEFKGYENGQAIFQATSSGGLGVFALAALVPVSQSDHQWIPIVAGIGGAAATAGLLLFLILRRRREKEAALTEKWPTGLNQDDWELR
jgi:hypothetical protein